MLFFSFFDFGIGWIIAAMWPLDVMYPLLFWLLEFIVLGLIHHRWQAMVVAAARWMRWIWEPLYTLVFVPRFA
jgi:hypothetical protein